MTEDNLRPGLLNKLHEIRGRCQGYQSDWVSENYKYTWDLLEDLDDDATLDFIGCLIDELDKLWPVPSEIYVCMQLEKAGKLRFTGNQHNPSWEWK